MRRTCSELGAFSPAAAILLGLQPSCERLLAAGRPENLDAFPRPDSSDHRFRARAPTARGARLLLGIGIGVTAVVC